MRRSINQIILDTLRDNPEEWLSARKLSLIIKTNDSRTISRHLIYLVDGTDTHYEMSKISGCNYYRYVPVVQA